MARRRRSKNSALGLIVAMGLVLAGHAVAQQPPPPVPVSAPDAQQAVQFSPPPIPTPGGPTSPAVPTAQPERSIPADVPSFLAPPFSQRFSFKIDPNAPLKDLLPTPPSAKPNAGPVLTDDLKQVPEAEFQARTQKPAPNGKQAEEIAHQLAKINHLNEKKTDAFMSALLANRDDLVGLPFAMGDDCRSSVERTKCFTQAVATVRQALNQRTIVQTSVPIFNSNGTVTNATVQQAVVTSQAGAPNGGTQPFWSQYTSLCDQEDATRSRTDRTKNEHVTLARIAALMQMLTVESSELRLGLVKYLTGVPHVEATKALAKLAIYSSEDDIRTAAIESLKVRREKDYTDILVKGLHYPWPAVAKRSAEAIARIGRQDLVPELVAVLDQDDPRLPAAKTVDGKKISMVREMVKINHHRNCMMCHSPGNPGNVSPNAITAEVPQEGQPLPLPSQGYQQSSPDLMVRIDVTYLRQDFSAMLPVSDAHPWPDMQRFDFFIRERKLTSEEAVDYKTKLTPKEAGVLSPYHKAALSALRDLTGKDTTPTADAWRKLLDLAPATERVERGVKVVD